MLPESAAILILSFLIFFIMLRSRHVGYAVAVTPLFVLPGAHLVLLGILFFTHDTVFGVRTAAIKGFVDMLAVVISVVLIAIISRRIGSSKNRKFYLLALTAYTVLLGWVFIWDSLQGIIMQ